MKLDKVEIACVLAGLRLLQERMERDGSDFYMPHFQDEDIEPPTEEAVDDLCERINCDDSSDQTENEDLAGFVAKIAKLPKDGEEYEIEEYEDKLVYEPTPDEIRDTLHMLIDQARELISE